MAKPKWKMRVEHVPRYRSEWEDQTGVGGGAVLRGMMMAVIDLAEHRKVVTQSTDDVEMVDFCFHIFDLDTPDGTAFLEALALALAERGYLEALKGYRDQLEAEAAEANEVVRGDLQSLVEEVMDFAREIGGTKDGKQLE